MNSRLKALSSQSATPPRKGLVIGLAVLIVICLIAVVSLIGGGKGNSEVQSTTAAAPSSTVPAEVTAQSTPVIDAGDGKETTITTDAYTFSLPAGWKQQKPTSGGGSTLRTVATTREDPGIRILVASTPHAVQPGQQILTAEEFRARIQESVDQSEQLEGVTDSVYRPGALSYVERRATSTVAWTLIYQPGATTTWAASIGCQYSGQLDGSRAAACEKAVTSFKHLSS